MWWPRGATTSISWIRPHISLAQLRLRMTLCLWLRWTWAPYSGWLFVAAVLQAIRSASLAMIPKTILWTSFSKDARYAQSRSISSIGLTVGVGSTRGGGASVG
ncbi:hypothetical protein CRG98_049291, partial [Punica granatum]